MRKCPICTTVYYLNERSHCLYDNTPLVTVGRDDVAEPKQDGIGRIKVSQSIIRTMLADRHVDSLDRIQYIVACYFRTRNLTFQYLFYRNEFLMGKGFKRVLIQPLQLASIIMLPWVLWDFIDSLFVRLAYRKYDEKCDWKFNQFLHGDEMPEEVRTYCKEYSLIIDDILTGRIAKSEPIFKERSRLRVEKGLASPYHDLCEVNHAYNKIFDLICVWVSIAFITFVIVLGGLPYMLYLITDLELSY